MYINQKILELVGLLHAIQRIEKSPDNQDELFFVTTQKRDAILVSLSEDQIKNSGFLTPQEKKCLLEVKKRL